MFYRFLKILLSLGTKLYYKEIKVKNIEYLKHDGPKIIIANHPNTMMDGWIIGQICPDKIFFMAKGTFFSSRFKRWFLNGIGLIPINRATEAKTRGVSNIGSFDKCYKALEEGRTLVIFPEGNSFMERQLRELKSGTARIALEAERRNNAKLNLQIIPIGLIYSRGEKFRSSILANIGEPIDPKTFLDNNKHSSMENAKALTSEFRSRLENLLTSSKTPEHEQLVDDLVSVLYSQYTKDKKKGIEKDFSRINEIQIRVNELVSHEPWKLDEVRELLYRIKWQLDKLEIKSDFLDRTYRPRMFVRQLLQSIIVLIIGLPIFIFGIIHSIIPFQLTDFIMPKIVKEVEYYAPIAILLGLIFYPLTYFGFVFLLNQFIDLGFLMKLIYFISMPLSGMFAFYFLRYISHISFKTNYIFLMKTEKETINSLKKDRDKLRSLIFN